MSLKLKTGSVSRMLQISTRRTQSMGGHQSKTHPNGCVLSLSMKGGSYLESCAGHLKVFCVLYSSNLFWTAPIHKNPATVSHHITGPPQSKPGCGRVLSVRTVSVPNSSQVGNAAANWVPAQRKMPTAPAKSIPLVSQCLLPCIDCMFKKELQMPK